MKLYLLSLETAKVSLDYIHSATFESQRIWPVYKTVLHSRVFNDDD